MTDQGGRLLMTLPALACPVLIISGSSRRPRWPLSAWRVLQPANVQCYQALFSATQLVMAVQWWPGLMNADWCSCALVLLCSAQMLRLSSPTLFLSLWSAPARLQLSTEFFSVGANDMVQSANIFTQKIMSLLLRLWQDNNY